jgi:hypothetical protein
MILGLDVLGGHLPGGGLRPEIEVLGVNVRDKSAWLTPAVTRW